jgi:hypothetical protein
MRTENQPSKAVLSFSSFLPTSRFCTSQGAALRARAFPVLYQSVCLTWWSRFSGLVDLSNTSQTFFLPMSAPSKKRKGIPTLRLFKRKFLSLIIIGSDLVAQRPKPKPKPKLNPKLATEVPAPDPATYFISGRAKRSTASQGGRATQLAAWEEKVTTPARHTRGNSISVAEFSDEHENPDAPVLPIKRARVSDYFQVCTISLTNQCRYLKLRRRQMQALHWRLVFQLL